MESLARCRLGARARRPSPLISHCVNLFPRFISRGVFAKPPSLYVHFNERVAHLLIFNPCAFAAIALFIYLFIYLRFKSHSHSRKTVSSKVIIPAGRRRAPRCFSGSSHLHLTYCSCLVLHLLGDARRLVYSFSQLRCVTPAYLCAQLSIQTARLPSFHLFFLFFFLIFAASFALKS